jgi:fibrillarin-like pre-rRNA processing protein
MDPRVVVAQEATKLKENGFQIDQIINLEPFDRDHGMIYGIYNS